MDRVILNQSNYSVKEIYQDFYALIADTFSDKGYKYRKSKHDMYKAIGDFKIYFDYQTFSYNSLDDVIDVHIHKSICFQCPDGKEGWIGIGEIDNTKNLVTSTFDIKNITHEYLTQLISAIQDYITYMELLVVKFDKVQAVDIKSVQLTDPYGKCEYESNGVDYKDQYYGKDEGLIGKACNADGSLNLQLYKELLSKLKKRKWYEYYTEESVKNVYQAFYRFLYEIKLKRFA